MRILLVPDKEAWSYHAIAKALVDANPSTTTTLDILPLKGHVEEFLRRERDYNRVLLMGHQQMALLPPETRIDENRWLTGIHSHHAFDPDLRTTPNRNVAPPKDLIDTLKRFRAVNAVSRRLADLFAEHGLKVAYTPNGVDARDFYPRSVVARCGALRVGVAYAPKHDGRKGVSRYVRPACERVGAVLVEAKARSDQYVAPENMPLWHNSYDAYVCASSSEGFSIAVLEAAATGRVVISTRVGGSTDLIEDGVTGFLVDREVRAIADRLAWVQAHPQEARGMGRKMRESVIRSWSWDTRAQAWLDFLHGGD